MSKKRISVFALSLVLAISALFGLSAQAANMSIYSKAARVAVTGELDKTNAGEKVTMFLLKTTADPENLQEGDIAYIEDTTVRNNGGYFFRFKFSGFEYDDQNQITNYKVYVKHGEDDITTTVREATVAADFTQAVLNITPGLKTINADAWINNLFARDDLTYTLAIASYDDNGKLVGMSVSPNTTVKNGETEDSLEVEIPEGATKLKALVWDGFSSMLPMCNAKEYEVGDIGSYRITYPSFTNKAVTFSFDDGRPGWDNYLIDILDKYGCKSTFNLVSYSLRAGYKDVYKNHEAANHTSHIAMQYTEEKPNPTDGTFYTLDQCKNSVNVGQNAIIEEFGVGARGLVWPYRAPYDRGEEEYAEFIRWAKDQGYVYARDSASSINDYAMPDKTNPDGWMYWRCTTPVANVFLLPWIYDDFLAKPDDDELLMFAAWGHAHEFIDHPQMDSPQVATSDTQMALANFEKFCKKVGENKDIWKATNIEIYDYEQAAKNVEVGENYIYNPSKTVTLYGFINGSKVIMEPESRAVPYEG